MRTTPAPFGRRQARAIAAAAPAQGDDLRFFLLSFVSGLVVFGTLLA